MARRLPVCRKLEFELLDVADEEENQDDDMEMDEELDDGPSTPRNQPIIQSSEPPRAPRKKPF
jgi:hypothetical protein